MISDSLLYSSYQVHLSVEISSKVLLDVNRLDLPISTAFLDIIMGQYLTDLISERAIRASTYD